MSKTDGEYELVLGNRQLLSAFFIIVIMFGVFFTMGYVVGRNSAPPASSAANTAATAQHTDAPSPAPPQPEAKEPAPAETKPAETKPVETKPVTPPSLRPFAPPKADEGSGGVAAVKPGPGNMYLQVAAAAQPQAGVVVDTLKAKGFPALLAQGPNAALFRVMVGPFTDAAALGKAKADLENAGFRPLVRK
jgi:cell division septation protein DedD